MGAAQEALERLLAKVGSVSHGTLRSPEAADLLASDYAAAAAEVYRALGGRHSHPPCRLGHWDLEFDGVAVELDEYLHFNGYRAATLASPVYQELPNFPLRAYLGYCSDHKDHCLKVGRREGTWSNASCESQFGPAASPGDLTGGGAPRWKQRAFYDFVKDLSPLLISVQAVRISVWDVVREGREDRRVEEALANPSPASAAALVELIRQRAGPRRT